MMRGCSYSSVEWSDSTCILRQQIPSSLSNMAAMMDLHSPLAIQLKLLSLVCVSDTVRTADSHSHHSMHDQQCRADVIEVKSSSYSSLPPHTEFFVSSFHAGLK